MDINVQGCSDYAATAGKNLPPLNMYTFALDIKAALQAKHVIIKKQDCI